MGVNFCNPFSIYFTGGRCVLKMDHHCPWINNCVGHHNHRHFVSFLFFAICGSLHSFGLLILTVYKIFIVVSSNLFTSTLSKFNSRSDSMVTFFLSEYLLCESSTSSHEIIVNLVCALYFLHRNDTRRFFRPFFFAIHSGTFILE